MNCTYGSLELIKLWIHLSILFLGLTYTGFSQAEFKAFTKWQVEDGLPQNSVKHIIQTRDGYIWLATEGGLVKFDGVRFKIYDLSNTPRLESNRILWLHESVSGKLLIGTAKGGLVLYENNDFLNISKQLGLEGLGVLRIEEDNKGFIWLTILEQGIIVIDPATLKIRNEYLALKNLGLCFASKNNKGEMIISVNNELYKWENGLKSLGKFPAIGTPDNVIYSLACTPLDNSIWLLGEFKLLRIREGMPPKEYAIPISENQGKSLSRMFKIGNDKLMFSFKDSNTPVIFDIPTTTFSSICIDSGSKIDLIYCALIDRENNTWFGSSISGLIKSNKLKFSYIDSDSSIKLSNFYPVLKDSYGRFVLGSNGKGLAIIDKGRLVNSKNAEIERIKNLISIVEWSPGNFYLLNFNSTTLVKSEGNAATLIKNPSSVGIVHNAIYKTRSGDILTGSKDGVFQIENDLLRRPFDYPHLLGIGINYFFEDNLGLLWLISDNSIYKFNSANNEINVFDESSGLRAKHFRGAAADNEGRTYIGSYGYGLIIIDGKKINIITEEHGLMENVVSTITEDKKGNIWLTGNKGLTKIKKAELIDLINGHSSRLNPIMYDRSDGLRNAEFNGGIQQSKFHESEDVYLFTTLEGCVRVDFSLLENNELPPPVHIEEIKLGDAVYSSQPNLKIPYLKDRIEFSYTALSFVSPKNVKFKYILEGYDVDWILAGSDRKTSYTNLQPGFYTFKVLACNNDGLWNLEGAEVAFWIVPPFYMTWWFYLLVFLFFSIVLSLFSITVYKKTKQKELEKSILMDMLPDLILTINKQGKYIDVFGNPEPLIRPFIEIKGKTLWEILPKDFADQIYNIIIQVLESGSMKVIEYRLAKNNSTTENIFEGRFVALNQNEALYIIRDITEARIAEDKMKASEKNLSNALEKEKLLKIQLQQQQIQEIKAIVDTEERERQRIAKDLHDSVGQLLSSVKMNLSVLGSKAVEEPDKALTIIENTDKYLTQITTELRSISYNLMPPSLEMFGIASAFEEEIKKLNQNDQLSIHFDKFISQDRFGTQIEITLYRLFQEIMNNIIKHSQATEVVIQLIQHSDCIQLMIEDNGKGFEVERSFQKKNSSGLKNLRSRVLLINGTIKIDSTLNMGTTINITAPLN